jgi:hypothetical protein
MRSALDRSPLEASQALQRVPLLNELIEEGHVLIRDGRLVIADHICTDHRFEYTVRSCRYGGTHQ